MLSGIVTLLLFTVIGNLLSEGLGLPVPGPVTGLILLVAYIRLKGEIDEPLEKVSGFCIRYLAALFLPGLVGVFFMGDLLAKQWLPIVLVILVATPVSLVLTALLMQRLMKMFGKEWRND